MTSFIQQARQVFNRPLSQTALKRVSMALKYPGQAAVIAGPAMGVLVAINPAVAALTAAVGTVALAVGINFDPKYDSFGQSVRERLSSMRDSWKMIAGMALITGGLSGGCDMIEQSGRLQVQQLMPPAPPALAVHAPAAPKL